MNPPPPSPPPPPPPAPDHDQPPGYEQFAPPRYNDAMGGGGPLGPRWHSSPVSQGAFRPLRFDEGQQLPRYSDAMGGGGPPRPRWHSGPVGQGAPRPQRFDARQYGFNAGQHRFDVNQYMFKAGQQVLQRGAESGAQPAVDRKYRESRNRWQGASYRPALPHHK